MILRILHLNIEKDRHIEAVRKLLKEKNPDIACFAEAVYDDISPIASELGYDMSFAPLVIYQSGNQIKKEGSAILSKLGSGGTKTFIYNENRSFNPKIYSQEDLGAGKDERHEDRFEYNYSLLTYLRFDGSSARRSSAPNSGFKPRPYFTQKKEPQVIVGKRS